MRRCWGPIAAELAYGEGLPAHARAAEMRMSDQPVATRDGFHVRAVDTVNVNALIKLTVAEHQRQLVAPVATSLAQAAYNTPGRPLGLYDGDTPVGFLLLWEAWRATDKPADELYVWRLMIDAAHQGRGYGAKAMRWVIDEARHQGVASVGLSHVDKEPHAGPFYEKLGFSYTGVVDEGERVMAYPLAASSERSSTEQS